MENFNRVRISPLRLGILTLLLGYCSLGRLSAQTGTFIDRQLATDLRVVTYNIYFSTIFPDTDAIQSQKFVRVVNALDADILNLQEVYRTPAEVKDLLDVIAPVGIGGWYTYKGRANIIASKYPLSM